MYFSKSKEDGETKIPSKMSRFAIVPILRGKTNSAVSDRLIAALKSSSFCSSNPITKKLLLQNVHVWCIVIETSGTQSIKVICASVPYLLNLLSRANPKLKQILEDEKVASYLKFFQETDMESVLASLCTATVIIQKGIRMCQPTLCVQLSRDALMFGNTTFKAILGALYNGIMSAFHFLWEDLGPAFHSFCSRNRVFLKYLAANLPVFALAIAKSLVLFSFSVRRMFQVGLKLAKRFVKFIYYELKESSVDIALVQIFGKFKMALNHVTNYVLSKNTYQYWKCMCISSGKWCVECIKQIIPIIWQNIIHFINDVLPLIKYYIRFAIQSSSTAARLLEENVVWFIRLCYNSKSSFQYCLLIVQSYLLQFSQIVITLIRNIVRLGQLTAPHILKLTKYFLRTAICSCMKLIQVTKITINYVSNLKTNIPEIYSVINYFLIHLVEFIERIYEYLYTYLLRVAPTLYGNVQPLVLPISKEIKSVISTSSNEIIKKSYCGLKTVVPSLWQGFKTGCPPTFYATNDIFINSTKAVYIMYPTIVKAIFTIHPDVSRAVVIVLKDSNRAFLEVSAVSYSASSQLFVAAKTFSKQAPIALRAVNKVAVGTSNAFIEISLTSIKARDRMLKDFKNGAQIVKSSFKSAELEFAAVIDEVIIEINDTVADSPDLIALVREGLLLKSYLQEHLTSMLCVIYSFISKKVTNVCLILKNFYYSSKNHISTFLTNFLLDSSGTNSVSLLAILYIFKVIYINVHNFFTKMTNELLSLKVFVSLFPIFYYLREIVDLNGRYILDLIKKYTNDAIYEILHTIIPETWNSFKCIVSSLWEKFCNLANNGWIKFEKLSAKIWYFISENFPELWASFKSNSESMWNKLCECSPSVWEYTLKTSPVMYSYNCYLVKSVWNLYVETFSQTWNLAVPLSSNSWSYTLDNCPKVWLTISENSKTNWELFCFAAENSWESVTVTSSSSWSLLNKIVSKSWHCGIRQVTTSMCCRTTTMLVNSLKISYRICAKTGRVMYFLFDELSGVNYQMMKFEEDSSESHEEYPSLAKAAIDFSFKNNLKLDSKIKLLRSSMKILSKFPMQVSEIYSEYLKRCKMDVCTISKLSFLPVSCSYVLGQDLVKKYYSVFTSFKNVYFPTTEMFPALITFNVD